MPVNFNFYEKDIIFKGTVKRNPPVEIFLEYC